MTEKVTFNEVNLVLQRQKVLKDITLSLPERGIIGLLGRNGAGKTSLLSLVASFIEPASGEVKIDGQEVFENPESMRQVLFIYPRDWSEESEKVQSYIEWIANYRKGFDFNYANHLLKKFSIPSHKRLYELSKGMQSAVSAIIGLASRAPITIFDETYLSMDAPTREIFYAEILKEQAKHPRLFIIATHLISEAEYLFDYVVILHRGELLMAEEYEVLTEQGCLVTGIREEVEAFTAGCQVLHTQEMGNLMSVSLYGVKLEDLQAENSYDSIEISPIPLQTLFHHLTDEGAFK